MPFIINEDDKMTKTTTHIVSFLVDSGKNCASKKGPPLKKYLYQEGMVTKTSSKIAPKLPVVVLRMVLFSEYMTKKSAVIIRPMLLYRLVGISLTKCS